MHCFNSVHIVYSSKAANPMLRLWFTNVRYAQPKFGFPGLGVLFHSRQWLPSDHYAHRFHRYFIVALLHSNHMFHVTTGPSYLPVKSRIFRFQRNTYFFPTINVVSWGAFVTERWHAGLRPSWRKFRVLCLNNLTILKTLSSLSLAFMCTKWA